SIPNFLLISICPASSRAARIAKLRNDCGAGTGGPTEADTGRDGVPEPRPVSVVAVSGARGLFARAMKDYAGLAAVALALLVAGCKRGGDSEEKGAVPPP